jgi:NADH-quinone oxidoreductase subunit J
MIEKIIFYLSVLIIFGGYIYLFFAKEIFNSILAMFIIFIFTGVIYFLMGIKFLGIFQIIIYAGAIMVLFIVAMNSIIHHKINANKSIFLNLFITFVAIIFGFLSALLLYKTLPLINIPFKSKPTFFELSKAIFEKYFLQIEIISFILLVAVVIVYSMLRSDENEL